MYCESLGGGDSQWRWGGEEEGRREERYRGEIKKKRRKW